MKVLSWTPTKGPRGGPPPSSSERASHPRGPLSDYVESFITSNIDAITYKLTYNSANNVKQCFVWCYPHGNYNLRETGDQERSARAERDARPESAEEIRRLPPPAPAKGPAWGVRELQSGHAPCQAPATSTPRTRGNAAWGGGRTSRGAAPRFSLPRELPRSVLIISAQELGERAATVLRFPCLGDETCPRAPRVRYIHDIHFSQFLE